MTFRTLMGSIGNAFKTGWNNGNLQKGMAATGMAAFTVGLTGNMIHDIKHNRSIFGCGCNSFGFGNGMNMFGCGMDMFGGMGMLNGMGGMFGMNNMYGYNNQMSNMTAYQWGQMLRAQLGSQNMYSGVTDEMLDKIAPAHDFKTAEGVNADTTKGKEFDENTSKLVTETDADPVSISDKTLSEDKDEYIKNLSEVAKSYISTIDTDADGLITEEEFINYEIEKNKSECEAKGQEFTDEMETYIRNQLKIAFAKLDLNRKGQIDWKEMTSLLATYDTGGKAIGTTNGGDGKIKASEYTSTRSSLLANNKSFATANWSNYTRLFGNPEKTE